MKYDKDDIIVYLEAKIEQLKTDDVFANLFTPSELEKEIDICQSMLYLLREIH